MAELAFVSLHCVVYKLYVSYLQYNHIPGKVLHTKYEGWKGFQVENITGANMHYNR